MISIVDYLFEFNSVTDNMAFEAAKRIAKSRTADHYDPENSYYRAQQLTRKAGPVVTSAGLPDKDQLNNWLKKKSKSSASDLLDKRFPK